MFSAGAGIQLSGRYRWASVLAWSLMLISFGPFTMLGTQSSTGKWVGYQIVATTGVGLLVRPRRSLLESSPCPLTNDGDGGAGKQT